MRSPLEHRNDWYDLPDVVEKAPLDFLREGWAWFVEKCEEHHSGAVSSVVNHNGGYCLSLEDDEEGSPKPGILTSFLLAVDEIGKTNPTEFVKITRPTWSSESAVVHKVLIRGLCFVVETQPNVGLEYLLGDARRFQVGTYYSHQLSDSISLITALAPRLSRPELDQLERAVLSWSMYRDEDTPVGDQIIWNRESRLRLLNAIGSEYLSAKSLEILESEKLVLKGWDEERTSRARAGFVRQLSPISKEQMLVASDDEILKVMRENPTADRSMREWVEVEGGWEEPGGAAAAGHQIAELLKENPARAMQIISHLVKNGSEEAATQAINGFADGSMSDDEAAGFMRAVAHLNPQSEELRSNVGYVLYRRCRARVGLPDDLCKILNAWLSAPWKSSNEATLEAEAEDENDTKKEIDSVLWSRGGFKSLSRAFFPLMALTNGYLMRSPPAYKLWLDAIERLIPLHIPVRTWMTYCPELRWIRGSGCDRVRGASIIAKLFNHFPLIKQTSEGIKLVAFAGDVLNIPFMQEFLSSLRGSQRFNVRLAYGELLTLVAFRGHHDPWARDQLESELTIIETTEGFDEATAIGIAFAASNLWDEPQARAKSSNVFSRLIPFANSRIAHAIETVFWTEQSFSLDETTEQLFSAFASNPTIFSTMGVANLVRHVVPLAAHNRKLALDICGAILESRKPDNDLFEAGPDLVTIAMTLQRFSETRIEGLTLLEEMLRIGLDDAFRVLRDIDIRPTDFTEIAPAVRRLRRRRRT